MSLAKSQVRPSGMNQNILSRQEMKQINSPIVSGRQTAAAKKPALVLWFYRHCDDCDH